MPSLDRIGYRAGVAAFTATVGGGAFLYARGAHLHDRCSALRTTSFNSPRSFRPTAQSDTIVTVMRNAGVPVVYALYSDGFVRPQNSRSFWAITDAFLARCLGGRAAPLGDALEGSSVVIKTGAEFVPGLADAIARRDAMRGSATKP
jgi:hypothetical protein